MSSACSDYPLKFPVELRNAQGELLDTVTKVTLRRLKGRDLKALDTAKGDGSRSLALLGAATSLPPSTVELLDFADVTALLEVVESFTGGSLPTGAPS